MKSPPKQLSTINNPTDSPSHSQIIFTYPPSASSLPSPQTQQTISPLTQSSFHLSFPSRNNLRILQWNANGIRPRLTELIQFLSLNQYDLIFVQELHLSSDSTFHIPYKTLQKNRSMTRRGTTVFAANLEGGVLMLVKNGLICTPLSTQLISSIDPSSDYLAITVKIIVVSPIHFFNVYVPPIAVLPLTLALNPSPFLLSSSSCHTPVDCANQLYSHLQSYFSTQTPKPFRSTKKIHINTIRTAHCNTLHSTFCSSFSSLELSTVFS